jgi:hypothetical protein
MGMHINADTIDPETAEGLFIIDRNSWDRKWSWRNTIIPAGLARQSNAVVLLVNTSIKEHSVKTIVVPVEKEFTAKKLALIHALARKFRVHICLAAYMDDADDKLVLPNSLLQAYRLLKTSSIGNISYKLLPGHNKEKAILRYCSQINADLLVLETAIVRSPPRFFLQRLLTQILSAYPVPADPGQKHA